MAFLLSRLAVLRGVPPKPLPCLSLSPLACVELLILYSGGRLGGFLVVVGFWGEEEHKKGKFEGSLSINLIELIYFTWGALRAFKLNSPIEFLGILGSLFLVN